MEEHRKGASFFKTCLNGINSLAGIGLLSMHYAVSQGGWLSFVVLLIFAITCLYTALLLQRCMINHPLIKSYPDIGAVAFGNKGRIVIAVFTFVELFLVAVELLILEGDNLDKLFPNMNFKIGHLVIKGKKGFVILAALVILPTTWLRSLEAVAYVSLGGVLVSIIIIICVLWVGVDGVGFHQRGNLVNWKGLLTAVSLFAFNYNAHGIMPTLCNSMNDRSKFSKVLMVCFVASTITNASMAALGYTMFGDDSMSQITLNMPLRKLATKIAIYSTIINPFTKYVVLITPIVNAIEDKWLLDKRISIVIVIRTIIVVTTMLVALFMPFYEYIMAFVGSFSCVANTLLFPCLCYLKINEAARKFGLELIIIIAILLIGILIGILGTYLSLHDIVKHL